ncbi:MAG: DUF2800 domain-containing protein [Ignavibacteria bacterium]|jgi:hypothetical protein|nr:DUF2800 domain-containing protein [Ignavibacteria bacterium]MCU7526437.1 DUF2800 domain-containing protein [Ignavibacteria bacterium]
MQDFTETFQIPASPDLLTKEQVSAVLKQADNIISWLNQVKEFALNQAIKGEQYEGFKVVEGRSFRKFKDDEIAAQMLMLEGYNEAVIYEKKLLSLAQLEKVVGKKNFEAILGSQIYKPAGKPALVPDTDERPAYALVSTAQEDFGQSS